MVAIVVNAFVNKNFYEEFHVVFWQFSQERKRKQIEKKLEEAAVEEREQAIRKKKELFIARREKQAKLEELERKMEVAEMVVYSIIYCVTHSLLRRGFENLSQERRNPYNNPREWTAC